MVWQMSTGKFNRQDFRSGSFNRPVRNAADNLLNLFGRKNADSFNKQAKMFYKIVIALPHVNEKRDP